VVKVNFIVTEAYPYLEYSDIAIEISNGKQKATMELTLESNSLNIGDSVEMLFSVGMNPKLIHNGTQYETIPRLNEIMMYKIKEVT
jgi:hypothetical protein